MNGKKSRNVNMLEGPITKTLFFFGLPMILGSLFQQLYNMVDSIVVGRYVGSDALAAVGASGTLTMVLIGIMFGFPSGGSVVAAQFLGAGRLDKVKAVISTTMIIMVAIACVLMFGGLLIAPWLMTITNVPAEIFDSAVEYFRIYLISVIFMALYNFFTAFLRTFGDSKTPVYFLIFSSCVNILGDLFFVVKLGMGVRGVAIATVISQFISAVLCGSYCIRKIEYFKFGKGEFRFDGALFKEVFRIGIPSSMQMSIAGFGMVIVQGLINSYGPVSMAAYTAASKMENICGLPMMGIGQGISIFVGQNVGAGNKERTRQGLRSGILLCFCLCIVTSMLVLFFGKYIMQLFVKEEEQDVIVTGVKFLRRWAGFVTIHGLGNVFNNFLKGAGDSFSSMISNMIDLFGRAAMAYLFAKGLALGFMGIAYSIPLGWLFSLTFSVIVYFSGHWKTKAVKIDTDK